MHALPQLVAAILCASPLAAASFAAPPLTPSQSERLATAVDGAEHREIAFEALFEWARAWDGKVGAALIRLEPNVAALARAPAEHRGDLCRLIGKVQQRQQLAPPYEDVEEWFVRNAHGVPFIVYVVGGVPGARAANPPADGDGNFRVGDRIQIDARFYKRIDLVGRDGEARGYPAFVGRAPLRLTDTNPAAATPADGDASMRRLWLVAGPVTLLLLIFGVLFMYARRRGGARHTRRHARFPWREHDPSELDAEPGLPDDPAAALAELKRRADLRAR